GQIIKDGCFSGIRIARKGNPQLSFFHFLAWSIIIMQRQRLDESFIILTFWRWLCPVTIKCLNIDLSGFLNP
ncbi:MAG: hypothetical protein PF482_00770, partial [Desulfobacteraceae bacterium]|nr:hypothetical protein [Desulfobacteraceae bacterium]